jgi:excisionase family DNA binding protein
MLTVNQVSQRLAISRSLVYREIRSGRLRAHRFGDRCYRVAEADLAAYIENNRVPFEAAPPQSPAKQTDTAKPSLFRHIKVNRLLSSQS